MPSLPTSENATLQSVEWEGNNDDYELSSSSSFRFVVRLRKFIYQSILCRRPCYQGWISERELDDCLFQNPQDDGAPRRLLSEFLSQMRIPSAFLGPIADEIESFYRTTRGGGEFAGGSLVAEVYWEIRPTAEPVVDELLDAYDDLLQLESTTTTGGLKPAAKSFIEGLEKVKKNKGGCKQGKCTICLEELEEAEAGKKDEEETEGKEELSALPCSHVFHSGCITQWLHTSHYCPLCRYKMPTDEEDNDELEDDHESDFDEKNEDEDYEIEADDDRECDGEEEYDDDEEEDEPNDDDDESLNINM